MAKGFEHVNAGEPISAAQFNAVLDAARASSEATAKLATKTGANALFHQRTIVEVKNSSGDGRNRFDVLGIDGPLFEFGSNTFKEFPRLKGIVPEECTHGARFVILQESISSEAIARAVVAGVSVARVDVVAESHAWADVADGECGYLRSCAEPAGAQILTVEEGTGVKWAIVRLASAPCEVWTYAELKTDLTPGSTATAYRLDDDLERIDTDPPNEDWSELTAKDILGTTRGAGADDLATPALKGTILTARKVGSEWHIATAQPWPLLISGLLTADLETTDATFKIDGVAVMNPVGAIAAGHLLDESDEVTVLNTFEYAADEDAPVIAAWDENLSQWKPIEMKRNLCRELAVMLTIAEVDYANAYGVACVNGAMVKVPVSDC